MKKMFTFLPLLLLVCSAWAQTLMKEKFNAGAYGHPLVATNVSLVADRNLAELGEFINVNVRITVADENTFPVMYSYDFTHPADAPWTIKGFKVVSGGATVVMTDGGTAQLRMPATMPADKAVMVQVTLDPASKLDPQVQLFTTIYLEDHENVFYYHCPAYGINNEKYILERNNGIETKLDSVQKKALAKNSPASKQLQQKLLQKRIDLGIVAPQNYDIGALTSNARGFYVKDQDVTTVTLTGDQVEMANGRKTNRKRSFMINISFPGAAAGTFILKTHAAINAAVILPTIPKAGCACGDDPAEQKRRAETGEQGPTCMGGTITITEYDKVKKIIKGRIYANLEGVQQDHVIYSSLSGKFAVTLAN